MNRFSGTVLNLLIERLPVSRKKSITQRRSSSSKNIGKPKSQNLLETVEKRQVRRVVAAVRGVIERIGNVN